MLLLGRVFRGLDFSSYFAVLGTMPAGYTGALTNCGELKTAGVPLPSLRPVYDYAL